MSKFFPLIFINSITTSLTTLAITYIYNLYIISVKTNKDQNNKIELLYKQLSSLEERMQDMQMYIEEIEDKLDKKHTKFIESNYDLNNKLDEFITSNYDIYT
jgi:peptidoglycan hydrolase CwlO-like protein